MMGPDQTEAVATVPIDTDRAVIDAWDAHHDELFGFLVGSCRDQVVAEDLLQDTFLRLTREARAGRMPALVRPWLYRVAANLAISRGRRRSTALRWLLAQPDPGSRTAESPESRSVRQESASDLAAALALLPADARAALLLAGQGFTGIEIAVAIGKSQSATRTLMCRARVRVRAELENQDGRR